MAIFISEKEMVVIEEGKGRDMTLEVCVDLNRLIIIVYNNKHQGM